MTNILSSTINYSSKMTGAPVQFVQLFSDCTEFTNCL